MTFLGKSDLLIWFIASFFLFTPIFRGSFTWTNHLSNLGSLPKDKDQERLSFSAIYFANIFWAQLFFVHLFLAPFFLILSYFLAISKKTNYLSNLISSRQKIKTRKDSVLAPLNLHTCSRRNFFLCNILNTISNLNK
jgi:hypothetical protein